MCWQAQRMFFNGNSNTGLQILCSVISKIMLMNKKQSCVTFPQCSLARMMQDCFGETVEIKLYKTCI